MNVQKAKIVVVEPASDPLGPAMPREFDVQFNPTDLTFTKGAQFAEIVIPGLDSPILQFVAGQNERLTLELFFDTTEEGGIPEIPGPVGAVVGTPANLSANLLGGAIDVRKKTEPFYQLVKIQAKTHAPPRIEFRWSKIIFKAVVDSIQQKYTLFSPEGVPLRATLTVSMREYKTLDLQVKELNLQSADHSKKYRVVAGDSLASIAAREYGDAAEWRRIATANELPSLRRLVPGTELRLPPADPTRQLLTGGF